MEGDKEDVKGVCNIRCGAVTANVPRRVDNLHRDIIVASFTVSYCG